MAKLKLSEGSQLAEIAGEFAVVVSLLYVGYQIQLNTTERHMTELQRSR